MSKQFLATVITILAICCIYNYVIIIGYEHIVDLQDKTINNLFYVIKLLMDSK